MVSQKNYSQRTSCCGHRICQANSESTGLPPSTIFIGLPMGLMFSLAGFTFRDLQIEQNRSGTLTGSLFRLDPSLDVSPMTWPPLTPPPAKSALKLRGQ